MTIFDLRGIPEEEILEELKHQNVSKVEKIKRKTPDGNLEETGLSILTFITTSLPTAIAIGYENVRIRTYIPLPLRCKNCLRYGHIGKVCTNPKICSNCSQEYHICDESDEVCQAPKSCINCKEQNEDSNHSTTDKKCPIFLKEKEIQAIVTLEKVGKKRATALYKERHSNLNKSYSTVLKSSGLPNQNTPQKSIATSEINNNTKNSNSMNQTQTTNNAQRGLINYSTIISDVEISDTEINDVELNSVSSLSTSESTSNLPTTSNVFLLPKNTSNKNKQKLKKKQLTGARTKK